jgi:peptidyl-dipeptidase Dcp
MHRSPTLAQLRYFYLEPAYRGIGLGKKMMTLYMEFLADRGYTAAYLWTTHEQLAAAGLYMRHGFRLVEEKASTSFGKSLREQRYNLTLLSGHESTQQVQV